MHLAVIVCENGLGHFKRSIGLLYEVKKRYENCKIDIICEDRQILLTKDWYKTEFLLSDLNVNFHTNLLAPSIYWTENPEEYEDGRLMNWVDRLNQVEFIREADFVISDNLVGVLALRPDTILMGSFLWADVLGNSYPNSVEVMAFVDNDRKLLLKHRPPMLCVDQIVMPFVKKHTKAIGLPWFAHEEKEIKPIANLNNKIAISAGASKISDQLIISILGQLKGKDMKFAIPERMISVLEPELKSQVVPFHFEVDEFRECDLAICRPGVGTATDCISAQTPMLLYYEENNIEMEVIAEKLVGLGIAKSIGSDFSTKLLLEALEEMYDLEILQAMSKRMQELSDNGFEEAIDWLKENEYLKDKTSIAYASQRQA